MGGLHSMHSMTRTLLAVAFTGLNCALAPAEVSFERDIRPILNDNCLQCHGPDEESRKGNLRLDVRTEATAPRDGHPAIKPGAPDESTVITRVTTADEGERMPPAKTGKSLKPEQVELLRQWIAEGANWPKHWAFVPPVRPEVPTVQDAAWVRNPIDAFVLKQLETEGLRPSPEATPNALLRRLSLDTTGLPPSPQEVDAFSGEVSDAAYAQTVERMLASPHFGERWARHWLDAAQFADSDGFEKDKPRQVWAWRDWVIRALNENMPYNRFITEQLAGDLLPNATQDQRVATGFLRNSMINEEGGIDPEQFRMEAMFNRMDVIGRAMLGLTVQCAQCHSHKYDPLTHAEYYQLMAYVNNTAEACMTVFTPEEASKRDEVLARVSSARERAKQARPDWKEQMSAWAAAEKAQPQPDWKVLTLAFDDTSSGGQKCLPVGDGSYLAQGYAPTHFAPKMTAPSPLANLTGVRLELLMNPNLPRGGPGRSIFGTFALTEFEFRLAPEGEPFENFDKWERIPVASALSDMNPPTRQIRDNMQDMEKDRKASTGGIQFAIDGDGNTAWSNDLDPGRSNRSCSALFKFARPVAIPPGFQLALRLHQNHGGWNSDDNMNNNLGCFRVSVTDALTLPDHVLPPDVLDAIQRGAESDAVFSHWMTTVAAFSAENEEAEKAWKEYPQADTQLVYEELKITRPTHRLNRGDFLQPAELVEPGVPAFLNPAPQDAPKNRLGLAQWLTSTDAPTTARAMVNKIWQGYFGTGLVATTADLGTQGDPPSHPELLDWLAVEFMASGWDVKALHRLILNSATYRQSSRVTPELLEKDPANRLLARGARFRVEGEVVRDIALAASGLLNPQVGGPSVYPPAPEFLFVPPASYGPKPWPVLTDNQRFRRGLYTFRYRSVPHPVLQAFDTPPGDAPCTRRARSNTPLQALTTLNEGSFMECAQALATRALNEAGPGDPERISYAFKRCVGRAPEAFEAETLARFLEKQRVRIASGGIVPATLLASQAPLDLSGDTDELAAWTLTARVMLNLDETITRE